MTAIPVKGKSWNLSVTRPWGSSQLIVVGYWSQYSGVLMFERMKIHQGVYFVEGGDDLHRNFLQANGGDFSFLAIQFMFKLTRIDGVGFVLIACVRVLMEEKNWPCQGFVSRFYYNSFSDLSWYFVFLLVLGEELASGCFFLMKLELKERFRMHQRNESLKSLAKSSR